ncbi:MAG TPA: metallophosphoesterase [Chitinophagaceae bacterium]
MRMLITLAVSIVLFGFILPVKRDKKTALPTTQFAGKTDGPYVLYSNEYIYTKYIQDDKGAVSVKSDSFVISEKGRILLKVNTDDPAQLFTVKLKNQLQPENTEYPGVNKMLVVSDIEGSFAAFRKMLQGNGVIDKDLNWTFGNGHLVLTGDFVDRGEQVTEVLWLIYSLEDKAKEAGGYVHYVLGNHEIMNMSGDLRYLNKKYVDNALLLNANFVTLYGENSELGRWLRTKNVAEKVGDILFIHAGISDLVNRMDITAPSINNLVRPYYADTTYRYNDPKLDTLYSDFGPFWYRGYYAGTRKASISQIDSTLAKFGVKHIATGHTVIADTVSMLYGGKVFNTDVHHAKGISEGLLVDGKNIYRVNALGEKFLLLRK